MAGTSPTMTIDFELPTTNCCFATLNMYQLRTHSWARLAAGCGFVFEQGIELADQAAQLFAFDEIVERQIDVELAAAAAFAHHAHLADRTVGAQIFFAALRSFLSETDRIELFDLHAIQECELLLNGRFWRECCAKR